jgi:nitroimidazol reductase NimA-like FMN-containing flavoprotein (pyridoxamine 5'-phosphate oxidase superfamily)
MDNVLNRKIFQLLDDNVIMSLATLRPDGWPQATTVGFAHDGLTLYFLCAPDSQKARNIAHDNRVSVTINKDTTDLMAISGLSMAARAEAVTDPAEAMRVLQLLMSRYPPQTADLGPMPKPGDVRLIKLSPTVISVIDYSKGFGHSDLVAC